MSTAIAMQDMPSHVKAQEAGVIRHRSNIKQEDVETPQSAGESSDWLNTPQDEATLALPLESRSFTPTNTYWVTPHGMLSRKIEILDLSQDISMPFTGFSSAYKEHVKKTMKDHSFTPVLTLNRNNWLGLQYTAMDSQDKKIADWKHSFTSIGEPVLTFPEDSQHCSHTITLKNKRWGLRTETFIVNSTPFFWEMDNLFHSQYMTLSKAYGTGENMKKVEVAKYAQKWWGGFVTGGTLVVDEKELDGVIVLNQNLKRHSKLVYSNQMTDHVVEQIDQLYWDAATTTRDLDSIHNGGNEDQTTLYQGDDLTLENNISKLPSTWDTSTDTPASDPQDPIDQDAYLSANAHLQDLSARRQVLRQKLSTYRALQELLAPYRDPRENVQPNLVHRDGPLETEMATTRTLAIRVAGRIGERYGDVLVPATADDGDGDADMGEEDGRAKLENVLSTW
ncbi:hypothetical protein EJ04DRAFT_425557 [Polyplosphaeria fusca]|uniref:Uncharacterized protein n=1 Tax=Polyplosphaeria fusca TaxID=682080 RepID=A0A9P4R8W9_9PLEO|nr:hypothetical protein EJ04DRAFT_425557 [Polyplosphaeria fusca]